MPRIRTIKPTFWDDRKVGKLSPIARLLFVGTWNFADDEGIILWDPEYIKAHLFPYDEKFTLRQVKQWMDEIVSLEFVQTWGMRSEKWVCLDNASEKIGLDTPGLDTEIYGFIKHMLKHQRINRPQPTTHTTLNEAIFIYNSVNTQGGLIDDSLLEGEGEGKGREEERITTTTTTAREGENLESLTSRAGVIFTSYESNIGQLTPAISDRLKLLITEHPANWVVEAIKKATRMEKRNLNYVEGILKGWNREGKSSGIDSGNTQKTSGNRLRESLGKPLG